MIWKRIAAWVIDWVLSGIPALIYAFVFREVIKLYGISVIMVVLFVLFVFSYPIIFVFRDVIFNGQSIAKRFFRLYVIDKSTNEIPSNKKLAIRNLFFFIYPIDAILLIATNQSIGDMVTETTVVCK